MTSLTVIILTFNEAHHIRRAIDSIRAIPVDLSIVVADSFSTDQTRALAIDAGAEVVQHEFESHARQFEWAVSRLPGQPDWIMRLDADEVLSAELAAEIGQVLRDVGPEVTALALKRQHVFWNRRIRFGGRYPTILVRLWRPGAASVEQRWMDEHVLVDRGIVRTLRNRFYDWNLGDLNYFTAKHNGYATREAVQAILSGTHGGGTVGMTSQAARRRRMKTKFYSRIPFPVAAVGYFLFRYAIQLGFLDGLPGLVYHGLQGLWYRFLVGARTRELREELTHEMSYEDKRNRLAELTGLKL